MERQCYKNRCYTDFIQRFMSQFPVDNQDNSAHLWISPKLSFNLTHLFMTFKTPSLHTFSARFFQALIITFSSVFGLVSLNWPCLWPAWLVSAKQIKQLLAWLIFGDLLLVNKFNSSVQTPFLCATVGLKVHFYKILTPLKTQKKLMIPFLTY